jgi:hypothetical protein
MLFVNLYKFARRHVAVPVVGRVALQGNARIRPAEQALGGVALLRCCIALLGGRCPCIAKRCNTARATPPKQSDATPHGLCPPNKAMHGFCLPSKAMHGLCLPSPFSERPNPSLHPVGMHGTPAPAPSLALLRLGGLPPPFCIASDARVAFEPVRPNAEPVLASHASHRDARDAWNGLGVGPVQRNVEPVLASHASHRDARDAWNALGVGLRGASAPLLHCEAMQPPVRPVRPAPVRPVRLAPVRPMGCKTFETPNSPLCLYLRVHPKQEEHLENKLACVNALQAIHQCMHRLTLQIQVLEWHW